MGWKLECVVVVAADEGSVPWEVVVKGAPLEAAVDCSGDGLRYPGWCWKVVGSVVGWDTAAADATGTCSGRENYLVVAGAEKSLG